MTVKELIELLKQKDENKRVVYTNWDNDSELEICDIYEVKEEAYNDYVELE